ncbi:aspartate aminotransferase family protein [Paralimibaculum aggregatum]|uniref:Aspartate aminotransferase family protein n=1 Tax=Paralimibaculum aggregatum TaxID=3036245 RepID=A0ABQ6LLK8_9RHOB|nr:aminotransferase [Limibaculum sp. NKW23]GMG84092.1 aspartate aminotransferase family protein [Limibaculum sp. NKW23]
MAHDTLTNAQMRDIEALVHPYTHAASLRQTGAHMIASGEGIYVTDEAGRRYVEGLAGLWCCGLGFGDAELVEAAQAQFSRLPYYHLFGGRTHEPAIELAEKLKELLPMEAARIFYGCSGSEANDSQIKLIWYMNNVLGRPEKKKILSRKRGYHGVTLATASLTGLPLNHEDFDLPLEFVRHLRCPHHWKEAEPGETEAEFSARLAAELEETILAEGPETVAAFIAEPVMGAGGVIVPPEGYFPAMQAVLRKYDVQMVADEVICGFGRTANWFGSETFSIAPNSMSMAKQLTGGYFPLSAVAMDRRMAEAVEEGASRNPALGHGFTYGGHPAGCAVALAALAIYERRDIVGHVRRVAPVFQARLRAAADHPLVGEARGAGLMGGLELSPEPGRPAAFAQPGKVGARLMEEMLARGVILRSLGDTLAFCPPMVITEAEIEEMMAPLPEALDATHAWARAEGHLPA